VNLVFLCNDLSIMGTYNVRVQALEPRHSATKLVYFNVILDCKVTDVINNPGQIPTRFYYTINEPQIVFPMPQYQTLPNGCNKPLKFALFISEIDGAVPPNPS